ncbi:hypothetical protein LK542_22700 [Massilia sp. IC2-477]|nr:hypothetical protein [Massilia sp. IC2-477]
MAVALLLLACHSGAALASSAVAEPAVSKAAEPVQAFTYQNGDLVLDIQDAAGAEILRAGLDYFFHDEHIATANEYPLGPIEAIPAQEGVEQSTEASLEPAPLSEPLSLTLFGAGLALLGWTRRLGSQPAARTWRQRAVRALWPWPSLSWLD